MRRVLAIAGNDLRRLLRDRSSMFFVFVFPLLLVLLIGQQFASSQEPLVVVTIPDTASDAATGLVRQLEARDGMRIQRLGDAEEVSEAVARGMAAAGVVVPADLGTAGGSSEIGFISRPDGAGQALRTAVAAELGSTAATIGAARLSEELAGLPPDAALAQARAVASAIPPITTTARRVGVDGMGAELAGLGQYDLAASSQLLLFVFLTSLTGSTVLIQSRQLGVARRITATPTSAAQLLLGVGLGRWAMALVQGGYIAVGTTLLFGVRWGDTLAAVVLIATFSLVAAGAGMLMGAALDNDQQAGGVGVLLGLGLAALGGSMAPLEIFPPTMQTVARITPHAWANEAFAELVRRGGNIVDILPQLGVLAALAVVLLSAGSWSLRRVLLRT